MRRDSSDFIKVLIQNVDVNAKEFDVTSLSASRDVDVESVDSERCLNCECKKKQTALHLAARKGHAEYCESVDSERC